jgi:acyl-CoA thioester hydrolase
MTVPDNAFTADLDLRVSDLSPAGHIGNVAYLRLLEEARFHWFGTTLAGGGRYQGGILEVLDPGAMLVIGQHIAEYRSELWYRAQQVRVALWVPEVGRSSLLVAGAVLDAGADEPAFVSETSAVIIDRTTRRPTPLDAATRDVLGRYAGPRPDLRPRRPLALDTGGDASWTSA